MENVEQGCYKECCTLQSYHAAVIKKFPQFTPFFSSWADTLATLKQRSDIETLKTERDLEKLALKFRTLWLQAVNQHTTRILKSPPHYALARDLENDTFDFPYDRWARPSQFENAYGETLEVSANWTDKHLFFGNAMSALTTLFLQCRNSFKKKNLSILGCHGYFEFNTLFQIICAQDITARLCASQESFDQALINGEGDIILIEPVYANKDLRVWDQDAFLDAWKKRANTAETVLLFDTTLLGDHFDLQAFLARLAPFPPALVIQVISALKLHQVGLELTNLGILSIFTPEHFKQKPFQERLPKNIRMARQTFGTGANFDAYYSIEFPFLKGNQFLKQHCQQVFSNNAFLAQSVKKTGRLLKTVVHPCLSSKKDLPWAHAPYVIFRLKEGSALNKKFMRRLIQHAAKSRGLSLQSGSSFGFRNHRFEMGVDDKKDEASFRVAMGARHGPSVKGIIDLLNDITSHDSFLSLREAFPDIKHPDDEN